MRYIDVTGKTEEEAIRAALSQLGLERDDVSVEILERSKSGFLGIGSSPAKVRVSYELDVAEEPEVPQAKPAEKKPVEKKPVEKKPEGKPEPAPEKQPEQPAAPVSETEDAERIRAFLTGLLEHMDCRAQVKVYEEEKNRYKVILEGQRLGALIGRRGETLDAIQYLASLVANRGEGEYIRLSIDSGNYREKRARTLEALARKLANQAVRTGRSITLEPMNAYERHVIHTALQDTQYITTFSIGTEPNRRVVVSYDRTKQ